MDRLQHLRDLLTRYQAQIQGLERAIVAAEPADLTRLKQRLADLREELRPYELEYERLVSGAPIPKPTPKPSTDRSEAKSTSLLESPTGSPPLESPFYVIRNQDHHHQALKLIQGQGITLAITGPRQVDKSSLLARMTAAAQALGKRVALLDFQTWDHQAFQNKTIFYRRFCLQLTLELGLPNQVDSHWQIYGAAGEAYCCKLYLQDWLLKPLAQPLVIALDKLEVLIDSPFRSEFFGMLQHWHNLRATQPKLKQLDLVFVYSTEPNQWHRGFEPISL